MHEGAEVIGGCRSRRDWKLRGNMDEIRETDSGGCMQ